jgi:alpha-tubulin suppressor-like RCC1 family protein
LGLDTGNETNPDPVEVDLSSETAIQSIAAGGYHTCAVLSDTTIRCWGFNFRGQLGTETSSGANPTPVSVGLSLSPGTSISSIDGGGDHTCALLSDNTSRCWGFNFNGQLGTDENSGTFNANYSPLTVNLTSAVTIQSIAAGFIHTCALPADNTVRCWGDNYYGQLGTDVNSGTSNDNYNPMSVNLGTSIKSVAVGGYHTCAELSDNTVQCWGSNHSGQIGVLENFETSNANPTPKTVVLALINGTSVKGVVAGGNHTCALISDNTLYCWGDNGFGQLGITLPESATATYTPILVEDLF